jgi:ribosomal protein L11 methyltransferase
MSASPAGSGGRAWPALVVAGLAGRGTSDPDDTVPAATELLHAALTDLYVTAVEETSDDTWRVFFQSDDDRNRASALLSQRFPNLSIQPIDVDDEDWARRTQENLRAVTVGRIVVAPPWDVPTVLTIQPSMGFGTGHHATTRLCLAALQRLELGERTVLDVGTGSGVLAIAASRLGSPDVTGIDDDADAIQAAWENLALNPSAQVALVVGDVREAPMRPADVLLANLTGGLLRAAAVRLRQLTNAGGRLILSGFMVHEEHDVVEAYAAFSVEHRAEEDGWVCVTLA